MKSKISINLVPAEILLVFVALTGCSSRYSLQNDDAAVKVRSETVTGSNNMSKLNYVGVVEDKSSVALSFAGIGTIESIYVNEGQYVSKGQLLAKLNPSSAQNMLNAAESALIQAQDAYNRLKTIYDSGSLPEMQMVEIETKLQQAQSGYNIAKKNLEDCSMVAPVNGIIGRKTAEAGENAIIGKQILTILDISTVKVRFSVPEGEISQIPADCKSIITVSALGNKEFQGEKLEKSVVANVLSHTYPVHITLSNPNRELLPGMVCKVEVDIGKTSADIVVPIGAVQTVADGRKFVWTNENGIAKRRYVATGMARGNGVEIKSGLSSGDRIVTEGYQKVSEGDKIIEQ
jgi:membrane fusion protein, multidrug efflux system